MNRLAIAFSTKDRVELSRRTVEPLLQHDKLDLVWIDGSTTPEGQGLPHEIALRQPPSHRLTVHAGVRGGADAAIVYALTLLLAGTDYEFVGLVENDVLLHPDWLGPCMALFERGAADGLRVGAVSARSYEDRILIQRDGYAVMHNLGAGMVIFRRHAAQIILDNFRTGWWPDNRRIFNMLSGLDIGRWGAFRTRDQWVTADWHWDAVLAQHGYASLAVTPALVEMIGQVPDLVTQGLTLTHEPVELLRNPQAFDSYVEHQRMINTGEWWPDGLDRRHNDSQNANRTIFPHQVPELGGTYEGAWQLRWSQGFGPFAWRAKEAGARMVVPLSGACGLMVGGGPNGARVSVHDAFSGYECSPALMPERPNGDQSPVMNLVVPAGIQYRNVTLTALDPGVTFYGIQTRESQPWYPNIRFDHATLPPAE